MQPLIIAGLSVIGVLIGATLQYLFGQRLESRKLLSNQKAVAYSDYFKAAAGLGQSRTSALLASAADAKMRIGLFGSNDVVRKLKEFEQTGAVVSDTRGQSAMTAVMNAMRKDLLGSKSVVDRSDLSFVLFGQQKL